MVSKDLEGSDLRTVWYDSRFYRVNILWEHGGLRIRDLHLFDEKFPSVYTSHVATSNECTFFTLPVIDGYIWSKPDLIAGMRLKVIIAGDEVLLKGGDPKFTNLANGTVHISWPLTSVEGSLEIDLGEKQMRVTLLSHTPYNWVFDMSAAPDAKLPFEKVNATHIDCRFENTNYKLKAVKGTFSKPGNGSVFRLKPQRNEVV